MDHDIAYRTQPATLAQQAQPSVRTFLICQNTLLRTGVSHILEGTRFIVAEDKSGGYGGPDLILLCDSLPEEGADETIKQVKGEYPGARLIALSDNLDPWVVPKLCAAGLDGLCQTGMSPTAMRKVLELVMLGEMFLPISVSLALLEQGSTQGPVMRSPATDPSGVASKFSNRERQILQRLTTGASNKLIARDLGVAEATIKVHIKAILRKAKAANRTQAAMWATQHLSFDANPREALVG
jgi:two-component system nitrate/nitrite response regulator NarL